MSENRLRQCPFCGKSAKMSKEQPTISCKCQPNAYWTKTEFQNAYCWKEIDALLAENEKLKLLAEDRRQANVLKSIVIQDKDAELTQLRRALAEIEERMGHLGWSGGVLRKIAKEALRPESGGEKSE